MKNKLGYVFSFLLGAIFAFSATYSYMENENRAEREELIKLRKAMLEQDKSFLIPNPFHGMGDHLDKLKKQMKEAMEEEEKKKEEEDTLFGSLADNFGNFAQALAGANITEREDESAYYYDLEVGNSENNKIDVNVNNGQLELSGRIEKIDGNSSFTSSFSKSLPIPANADASKLTIDQDSKEGVLIIVIPKKK